MGCKTITNQTSETFSLDKMYDEDYTLQQIYNKFKQLSKEWKTLNKNDATLLEEIHNYLEENYYKCYIWIISRIMSLQMRTPPVKSVSVVLLNLIIIRFFSFSNFFSCLQLLNFLKNIDNRRI